MPAEQAREMTLMMGFTGAISAPSPFRTSPVGLGTVADNVLDANDIIYLKSNFVHYPQTLIYAYRCRELSNPSRCLLTREL